jgi:uncharacterized membrane protein
MQNILKKFLQINNYHRLGRDFEDYFLSHPNYPSLYAVTDTLTLLGVENIAAKIPKEIFFDLPISFLAIYKEELVLVEKTENEVYVTKESDKRERISFDSFFNNWDGIVLAIGENENQETYKVSNKYLKYFLLSGTLLIFYFLNSNQNFNLIATLGFSLSFMGFLMGILIVNEKYGTDVDPLVSKFCSFSENTSCTSVIKSSSTLITKWVDFSDLPIVFFASALVSQLLSEQSVFVVSAMSIVSLPLVAYSIWLQKSKIKKWCVLCLAISSMLLLLSLIQVVTVSVYSVKAIADFFVIGSIVITVWSFIKPYLSSTATLTKENFNLKKFKRTPTIFKALLKPVANYDAINSFNKILVGEIYTPINVTLLLSPSCSHCHTAYKEATELYKNFQNKISINILFNVNPNNQQNNYLDVIFTMLYINKNSPNKILEALNDWHITKMTLENWLAKWNNSGNDFQNEKYDLYEQYNWCQMNNFNFTPVRLLNDNTYPTEYSVDDIKYFISEWEEIKEIA